MKEIFSIKRWTEGERRKGRKKERNTTTQRAHLTKRQNTGDLNF